MDATNRTITQLTEQPSSYTQEIALEVIKHSHLPHHSPTPGHKDEDDEDGAVGSEGAGEAAAEEEKMEKEEKEKEEKEEKERKRRKKKGSDLSYSEEIAMEVLKHTHLSKKEKERRDKRVSVQINPHLGHIVEELIAERSKPSTPLF